MSVSNDIKKLGSAVHSTFSIAEQSTLVRKLNALSTVATANLSLDEQFIRAQNLLNRSPAKALARKITGLRIGSRDDLSTLRNDLLQGPLKPGEKAPLTPALENLKKFILENQHLILSVQNHKSANEYIFEDELSHLQDEHVQRDTIKAFTNLYFTPDESFDTFHISDSWIFIADDT